MTRRVINFNAGPAGLPLAALEAAQQEFLDFQGTGMSIMEHSHRGKDYEAVHNEAIALLRELLAIPDGYDVLFLQGGASHQFAMVPMNLLPAGKSADYVVTGVWAEKALAEAQLVGKVRVAATTAVGGVHTRVPTQRELDLDAGAAYVHYTTNNTIFGTQFHYIPDVGTVPLIADMSSDILWKPIDVSKFTMIYGGAQKNIGPSGVTVVIARKALIASGRTDIPKILRYATHAKESSLYNTAPTFAIYMVRNVLRVLKAEGGLAGAEKRNREKAKILYEALDASGGYYEAPVEKQSRSTMNIVFRLPSEALDAKFVADAKAAGMVGVKGHRLAGGIRISAYNAVTVDAVRTLVGFMDTFRKTNPAEVAR